MLELKLYVNDVDYESVIGALAGQVPGAVLMAARALPDSAKEEMAAKYINANVSRLTGIIENALASKGVRLKISGAQVGVIHR